MDTTVLIALNWFTNTWIVIKKRLLKKKIEEGLKFSSFSSTMTNIVGALPLA